VIEKIPVNLYLIKAMVSVVALHHNDEVIIKTDSWCAVCLYLG